MQIETARNNVAGSILCDSAARTCERNSAGAVDAVNSGHGSHQQSGVVHKVQCAIAAATAGRQCIDRVGRVAQCKAAGTLEQQSVRAQGDRRRLRDRTAAGEADICLAGNTGDAVHRVDNKSVVAGKRH